MDIRIQLAGIADVCELNESAQKLFDEDGGRHDPFIDTGWPAAEGERYYANLVHADDGDGFLAYQGDRVIGHLVARILTGNPVRPNAIVAELESMRVSDEYRRRGIGSLLVRRFFQWAEERGANEYSVSAYAANVNAIAFYQHHGFQPFTLKLRK